MPPAPLTPAPPDASPDGFPPPPAAATTCPSCGAAASPRGPVQTCAGCKATFLLRAGALLDPAVKVPPPDPTAKDLTLKAPGLMVTSQAMLMADRVGYGALDPILGRFPLDIEEKSVRYPYLYSVAVWKAVNSAQAVTFFLVSLWFGLLGVGLLFTVSVPGLLFGLPLIALAAHHGWRVFGRKALRVRVMGVRNRTLDMTLVGSIAARQRFLDELFRRSGLEPAPLP